MVRVPSVRVPPLGFAHRGARALAPENTLEAFALALKLGATGIESDAWLTADGRVVLDHDGLVGRRPRRRPVSSVTRAELPAHVPTLEDLYDACGTGVELSLDVKDAEAAGPIVEMARAAGDDAATRLWLCHHDWRVVASWRERFPEVHLVDSTFLGHMKRGPERRAAQLAEARIDAVNLHHTEWTGGLTALFHRFEVLCFSWDCQLERHLAESLDHGVDAVYSDHVDRMVDAISAAYP